jgi:hypothetical protein
MNLNTKQLSVLIIAVILFSLSELFPPWLYENGWDSAKRSAGYHYYYSPPESKSSEEMKKLFRLPENESLPFFSTQKDFLRLYSQRLSLLFLTTGLLLTLSCIRSFPKTLFGCLSICVGIVSLLLVLKLSWSVHY